MFLWPVTRFWKFKPWVWPCAVLWNVCEIIGVSAPYAPQIFGMVMGAKKVAKVKRANPSA